MKIKLDKNNRKFIEIEIDDNGVTNTLKYFEKNTKQIKAIRKLAKKETIKMITLEDENEKQFFENLKGDKEVIDALVSFYEENGNIYRFIGECNVELGKLNKSE